MTNKRVVHVKLDTVISACFFTLFS